MEKRLFLMLIVTGMTACTEPNYRKDKKMVIRPVKKEVVEIKEEKIRINLEIRANFDFDKWELLPEDKEKIDEFVKQISEYEGTLSIIGHTDSRGKNEYNKKLSLKRAVVVKEYIENNLDITNYNLNVTGEGEEKNLVEEKTKDDMTKNRRVEILFEEK